MSETAAAAEADMPQKLDPEAFVLRGRPRPAVRFKRWLVVGMAAALAILLMLTAWFALRPRIFRIVATEDQQSQPNPSAPSDALASLPKSYADVPKLGPPLPGDLGKPILAQQQTLGTDAFGAGQRAVQAADAERQRRTAELKAARESAVIFQSGAREESVAMPAPTTEPMADRAEAADRIAFDPDRDPNGQQRKADFSRALAGDTDVNPHQLSAAPSPYTLSAGSVIAASLITGLKSDMPGMVTAQVTQDVYDSATGATLLIPQGARLIGRYDSVVAFGQTRALVVWQRLLLPSGSSLKLDNAPATDAGGYAGLKDKVDLHTWALLKGVALSTLLGVGAELQFTGRGGLIEAIRQSGVQNVSRAGDQLTSKALSVQPTITIQPGTPVQMVVQKDLILAPWRR